SSLGASPRAGSEDVVGSPWPGAGRAAFGAVGGAPEPSWPARRAASGLAGAERTGPWVFMRLPAITGPPRSSSRGIVFSRISPGVDPGGWSRTDDRLPQAFREVTPKRRSRHTVWILLGRVLVFARRRLELGFSYLGTLRSADRATTRNHPEG